MTEYTLKPFYQFNHKDISVVININNMQVASVDKQTAGILSQLSANPAPDAILSHKQMLKSFNLLSCGKAGTCKTSPRKDGFFITNVALFLTQSCNLRCIYCYGNGGKYGKKGHMDETTALQSIDWLLDQSEKKKQISIGFFGGEPFLNFPLMKTVVASAKRKSEEKSKQVLFKVTTNATLLTDERIAFMKAHDMDVMVSLDGPRNIQDLQRPYASGKGSYEDVARNCRKLLKVMPQTHVHAVLMDNNDPRIIKTALSELGFQSISIVTASDPLSDMNKNFKNNNKNMGPIISSMEQDADDWLIHIRERRKKGLYNAQSNSLIYPAILALFHNKKKFYACGAGLGMAGVSINGDIYLCHRFVGQKKYKIGTVFNKELDREEYKKTVTCNEFCQDCFARYYCAGGCKYDNVSKWESIFQPAEDICQVKRRELELAAYVVSCLDESDKAWLINEDVLPPKPCMLDF